MSLNYNLERIAQFKDNFDLAYQEYKGMDGTYTDVKRDLKQLIFASMMISLNYITYKNVAEWYARFKICEELYGISFLVHFTDDDLEYIKLTPSALKEYIGLGTNHSTLTRKEWVDNVLRQRDIAEYMTEAKLKSMIKKYMNEFDNS